MLYVKFDEKGKAIHMIEADSLEKIKPDKEGYEPVAETIASGDQYYLFKREGKITVDDVWKARHQAELELAHLRIRRANECFTYIDRSVLWFDRLTDAQKEELRTWYQGWLDVTETRTPPERPSWIEEV